LKFSETISYAVLSASNRRGLKNLLRRRKSKMAVEGYFRNLSIARRFMFTEQGENMKIKFFLAFLFLTLAAGVFAQGVPAPRTLRLQPFLTNLSSPVFITHAKDGSRRLFVVEQRGLIKVVQPGSNTATNFIDLSSKVSQAGSERGLLGLAFHPQFSTNSYFFVNYTRQSDGATVIARYRATNNNTVGDLNSERIVLVIPQPFSNHNGGMIEFRNDNGVNNLYIGMGDGGSANDPQNHAQNINSLLGKFLRITPDLSENLALPPYTIPADNPFVGTNGADEIYAVGVRNPFRWSFDRANPSQLWAGDVGQGAIEEVDLITRGGNYGWRVYEGTQCTGIDPALCNPNNFIAPVFQYGHTNGRCSVTGGYVYRGGLRTLPDGAYIYGDFCTGEFWVFVNNQTLGPLSSGRNISSFGEDEDGELYLVGLGGTIDKIVRVKASADFDGDLRTDFSVFRPSSGVWFILNSSNSSLTARQFGLNGDIPVPEDYDGDNITDIGVFRPSSGTWFYLRSRAVRHKRRRSRRGRLRRRCESRFDGFSPVNRHLVSLKQQQWFVFRRSVRTKRRYSDFRRF
jgi:glucose/arabinose dehydrogenase